MLTQGHDDAHFVDCIEPKHESSRIFSGNSRQEGCERVIFLRKSLARNMSHPEFCNMVISEWLMSMNLIKVQSSLKARRTL
jgi:hypothetical protein